MTLENAVSLPAHEAAFKSAPHTLYDVLRAGPAVARVVLPFGQHAWVVTRHRAARQFLSDTRLSKRELFATKTHPLFNGLLSMDAPEHTALRATIVHTITAARIGRLMPRLQTIAHELLDRTSRDADFDLMSVYALPLPFAAICELLGIPEEERASLLDLLDGLERAEWESSAQVDAVADKVVEYVESLAAHRRRNPADDVITDLVDACDRGELPHSRLAACIHLLIAAGHETTTHLIGNGVHALLRAPNAWPTIAAQPQRWPRVIDELLRIDGPLEFATFRFATEDIPVDDELTISRGDRVLVCLLGANHDPARFVDPHRLSIQREGGPAHLAFGHGIHACLGARMARTESEIALRVLAERWPKLELSDPAGGPPKLGLITRGFAALRVVGR